MSDRTISLVTGGAASGKSRLAEQMVRATGKPKIYIATLRPFDDEMRKKAADHRVDRGDDWVTQEVPIEVADALAAIGPGHVILLDCVTLWLSNLLLSECDIPSHCSKLITALLTTNCDVVVVSNEVGMGIVPDNALAREFRNAQGRLNQMIAAEADNVVTVISGLPLALKGKVPL